MNKQPDSREMAIFESTFKNKKDQELVMSFNNFLHNLTGLNVDFCLSTEYVDNKKMFCASYAFREDERVLFVFTHCDARSLVSTIKAMLKIIEHVKNQPDVNDMVAMLIFIELYIEPSPISHYIIQQFREIMIFAGQSNPGLMQHFLDTKAYFNGEEGNTVH